jgi:hypothetical protein
MLHPETHKTLATVTKICTQTPGAAGGGFGPPVAAPCPKTCVAPPYSVCPGSGKSCFSIARPRLRSLARSVVREMPKVSLACT